MCGLRRARGGYSGDRVRGGPGGPVGIDLRGILFLDAQHHINSNIAGYVDL